MNDQLDHEKFSPRLFICLKNYNWSTFLSDLIAGLTVGLVALPLAMAFAISSGVPPQSGIYCAVIAGFIISALGGSRTQIGGPTGAFVVVVSGIVAAHGIDGLFTCTLMAGIILIILGLTGLGTAVKYIPRPVVIGFTNGIAVVIASTQLKDFLGLYIERVPGDFLGRINSLIFNVHTFSTTATLLAASSLLVLLIFRRFIPKVPGSIVVLFGATIISWYFGFDVETINSRFGGIPEGLPHFAIPNFRVDLVLSLLSPTITIAMLGAIESLLSAVVADRLTNDRHNPNVELFAQGVANVFSPLAGGLPATGAIARTVTNIRSGARTPVAGMIHACTLLFILVAAAPLAGHVPMAVLAAILLVVSYNMGEWQEIPEILRLSRSSIVVWAITFALTVLADLTVAVEAGMALAALLYIRKVSNTTTIVEVTEKHIESDAAHSLHLNPIPADVAMFRIHGPFLFGSTDKLDLIYEKANQLPPVIIIRLRNMNAIDATGLHALEELALFLKSKGKTMLVCGMRDQPAKIMEQGHFAEIVGKENYCASLKAAVSRAKELLVQGGN